MIQKSVNLKCETVEGYLVAIVGARDLPAESRKVDVRLPTRGNSNSHGARPVHLILSYLVAIVGARQLAAERLQQRPHLC